MTYRGQVKGGVVVFEGGTPPEGASVQVEVVDAKPQKPQSQLSIWQKLRKYSGTVTGLPADMARNHDHYIHGGPRK